VGGEGAHGIRFISVTVLPQTGLKCIEHTLKCDRVHGRQNPPVYEETSLAMSKWAQDQSHQTLFLRTEADILRGVGARPQEEKGLQSIEKARSISK